MKNYTALQSKTIDLIRFPLAIAVVFIHSFGMPETADIQSINYAELTGMDLYNLLRVFISQIIASIAIPTFYVTAGFLFFCNIKEWSKQVYFSKIKSRVGSLIVPYILWNIIAFVAFLFIQTTLGYLNSTPFSIGTLLQEHSIFSFFWDYNSWGEARTNILGWHTPATGPIDLPLWFLRDLIVATILTPAIYYLLKYTKVVGVLVLGAAYYSNIWTFIPGFSITSIFFFAIGAYLGLNKMNLVIASRRVQYPCYLLTAIAALGATYLYGSEYSTPVYHVYVTTGVVSFFNLGAYLLEQNKVHVNTALAKSGFFIYAIHTIVILPTINRAAAFLIPTDAPLLLTVGYLIKPLLCTAICLGIYFAMQKYTPKLLGLLTGNR